MEIPNHSREMEAKLAESEKRKFLASVSRTRGVASKLKFVPFRDYDYVYLAEPLIWQSDLGHQWNFRGIEQVVAVENFVTDLTSVPRIFWALIPPHGPYAYGAVIHDYLYWHQSHNGIKIDRKTADQIFKLAMDDMNVPDLKTETIYRAVRWFGKLAWKRNKSIREKGERRLLVRTPPNAQISWKDWKSDPNNFGEW